MLSAREALDRLRDGNARFVVSAPHRRPVADGGRSFDPDRPPRPFAAVVGCSDPRVVPEAVFDQGIGDLFVVRVAGNVAAPAVVDSVRFAIEVFGIPVVVVLGHSGCAAVELALESLRRGSASPVAPSLVQHIGPAIEPLLSDGEPPERETLWKRAVRANVTRVTDTFARTLTDVAVVGAEYSLETRVVEFYADDGRLAGTFESATNDSVKK